MTVPGVKAEVFVPEIANNVPHIRVTWEGASVRLQVASLTPKRVVLRLVPHAVVRPTQPVLSEAHLPDLAQGSLAANESLSFITEAELFKQLREWVANFAPLVRKTAKKIAPEGAPTGRPQAVVLERL